MEIPLVLSADQVCVSCRRVLWVAQVPPGPAPLGASHPAQRPESGWLGRGLDVGPTRSVRGVRAGPGTGLTAADLSALSGIGPPLSRCNHSQNTTQSCLLCALPPLLQHIFIHCQVYVNRQADLVFRSPCPPHTKQQIVSLVCSSSLDAPFCWCSFIVTDDFCSFLSFFRRLWLVTYSR